MNNNIIKLSEEQLSKAVAEWSDINRGFYDDSECLCGYYECYINDIGYLTIESYCKKSYFCPKGMKWSVSDRIKIWNKSVCEYGTVPNNEQIEEDDDLHLLGYLHDSDYKVLKQVVRKSIIRDYSSWNTDEYGNTEGEANFLYEDISTASDRITNNKNISKPSSDTVSLRKSLNLISKSIRELEKIKCYCTKNSICYKCSAIKELNATHDFLKDTKIN